MEYLFLALAWTAYGVLHSAMISETATSFLERRLGASFRFYRLFFSTVSLVLLVPVVWYARTLEGEPVVRWEGAWRVARYALVLIGLLLLVAGGRHYSLRRFIGISQLQGRSPGGLATAGGIDSSGVLGLVRHPWYTAVLLLLWARDLDVARLVVGGVLSAYVVVGALLEERKLVREFGDGYRAYQERVSMFVPVRWLRDRCGTMLPWSR